MRRLHRASTLVVVAVCSTLLAGIAVATTPLGNPKAETQSILKALESRPDRQKKLAKQPVDKARQALDRANQARSAGDYPHADMLDSLALEWAQTARDVTRAAAAEAKAEKIEKQAADAARKARRARALLEETVARRGRAQERLDQLEKAGAHPAPADKTDAHSKEGKKPAHKKPSHKTGAKRPAAGGAK